jgi:hypothetical protein
LNLADNTNHFQPQAGVVAEAAFRSTQEPNVVRSEDGCSVTLLSTTDVREFGAREVRVETTSVAVRE